MALHCNKNWSSEAQGHTRHQFAYGDTSCAYWHYISSKAWPLSGKEVHTALTAINRSELKCTHSTYCNKQIGTQMYPQHLLQ
jgi:hypothetical protein